MIIKKKHLSSDVPFHEVEVVSFSTHASAIAREPLVPPDPYSLPLSSEVFEHGQLADRRRKDRRQGYRRVEDQELISRANEEANAIREHAAQEGFSEGIHQGSEVIASL